MRSDAELRRTYETFVDDDGLLHAVFNQSIEDETDNVNQAVLFREDILEILKCHPERMFDAFTDLLPLGKGISLPLLSLHIYSPLISHDQIRRVSVVGSSNVLRIAVNAIAGISGKRHRLRWFHDRTDALNWLK